jgi:hypothetical protein
VDYSCGDADASDPVGNYGSNVGQTETQDAYPTSLSPSIANGGSQALYGVDGSGSQALYGVDGYSSDPALSGYISDPGVAQDGSASYSTQNSGGSAVDDASLYPTAAVTTGTHTTQNPLDTSYNNVSFGYDPIALSLANMSMKERQLANVAQAQKVRNMNYLRRMHI